MKNIIGFVIKNNRKYLFNWFLYIILCGISSFIGMLQPLINGNFIDSLISIKINKKEMVMYVGVYVIIFIVGSIVSYLVSKIHTELQYRVSYSISMKTNKHILDVPYSFTYKKNSVYISELINNESCAITSFALDVIQDICKNCILIVVGLFLVMKYMGAVGSIVIFIMPIYYLVYITQKRKLYDESLKINELDSVYFSKLYGLLSNSRFLKINGIAKYFSEKVDKVNEQGIEQSLKLKRLKWKYGTFEGGISTVINVFLILYLGNMILEGKMSIGEYTIISSYFAVIMSSAKYFFDFGQRLQDAKASYERINNLLKIKKENNGDIYIDSIDKIDLQGINFSYGNKKIYENFSLELDKGKIYTIVGKNGAGKSTLVDIIIGLLVEQMEGKVLINNINMLKLDMKKIRKNQISLAEQNPYLFEDTIHKNIVLDNIKYDQDKFNKLLRYFNMKEVIEKMPQGYETMVYEDVINLSGGEKQKISLIRTFLKDSKLVILDEPTNALDIKTKYLLMEYIESIKKDKIIIIISHDNDMRQFGDKIIEL